MSNSSLSLQRPIRWGILGAANIARKNWKAIQLSGNGVVAAVASRTPGRAQSFIAECQAHTPFVDCPKASNHYEALIADPEIDAMYIPLPTGVRKEWVLRAAAAGKHVVCEKPCSVTLGDLAEMIDACARNRVQFMDGVMFMHGRRLQKLREVLDDGETVGPIRRIQSVFTFNGPEEFFRTNIRVQSALEPHGCLGDLGWYCLRFALWAMRWQLPREVTGRALTEMAPPGGGDPVATEFSGELLFHGGASCGFYCSFGADLQHTAIVSGARGYLRLDDFVLPFYGPETSFETLRSTQNQFGCDFNMEPRRRVWTVDEYSSGHPTAQETNLFRNFADQVQSGGINAFWPEMAFKTQRVMQACLDSATRGGARVAMEG